MMTPRTMSMSTAIGVNPSASGTGLVIPRKALSFSAWIKVTVQPGGRGVGEPVRARPRRLVAVVGPRLERRGEVARGRGRYVMHLDGRPRDRLAFEGQHAALDRDLGLDELEGQFLAGPYSAQVD